jgi:hypothetical protein
MNISIEKTKKNAAIFRKMADEEDFQGAMKARQAFAAFIRDPILEVIEAYPALQSLFTNYQYDYGTPSTIPLAPLFDIRDAGFVRVWAQSRPGGLATSSNSDVSELPVSTYGVESAVAFPLNFVRAARVDVIAAYLEHMSQNFLKKTETNSAVVISAMIAQTTYQLRGTATRQVYRVATQGTIIPQDMNAVNRIMARVNTANIGGTPAGAARAVNKLVGSPEFVEKLRNTAFQALNTNNTNGALGGPDQYRSEIYNAAGDLSWMGAQVVSLNDLGQNQPYNILFAAAGAGINFPGYAGGAAAAFAPGSEEVVYAFNTKVKSLARLTESNPDSGSTLRVLADNQFTNRAEELGFYAKMREGRVGLDGMGCVGLIF